MKIPTIQGPNGPIIPTIIFDGAEGVIWKEVPQFEDRIVIMEHVIDDTYRVWSNKFMCPVLAVGTWIKFFWNAQITILMGTFEFELVDQITEVGKCYIVSIMPAKLSIGVQPLENK